MNARARPIATLVRVPTEADLERVYHELAERGASVVGRRSRWPYTPASDEELVCLAAEMARHDARLLGALVELVLARWQILSPVALRRCMRSMAAPQSVCVVVDFARAASHDRELGHWARHVTADWPRLEPARHFFVDDVRPGERTAVSRLGRSLSTYSRWGFLAVERPTFDPHGKRTVGRYDAATRRRLLLGLVAERGGVTLLEYLEAVDRSVTRQQARADLRAAGLVPEGRGPGARWAAVHPTLTMGRPRGARRIRRRSPR